MAILKCKMCGGQLDIQEDQNVVECEYCGTKQTVPTLDNEKKSNLFNRANRLRMANEFDKAAGIYESIVAEFTEEAEAYWGLVLCKYGIEYVDDPKTGNKIPTCHRTSFESIFDDVNFKTALDYSDSVAVSVYRNEAKEIERLQKAILDIASKEDPFDVFICYKETAEDGQRTKDSVMAQDIYDRLTDKGYKVFFSRITLEDKLGQQYEPYIFSALNSAKVMLAIGTKYDYFNAVWVKNEWSRYLELMKTDKEKLLIPCYADIDAYDMPDEFRNLQGQDMTKIGFIQDLLRGVEKIIPLEKNDKVQVEATIKIKNDVEPLLQRAKMFLDDKEFIEANMIANMVLNYDPTNTKAHLICLLSHFEFTCIDDFKSGGIAFYKEILENKEIEKFRKYGSKEDIKVLDNNISLFYNGLCENLEKNVDYAIEKNDFKTIDDIIDEYKILSNYEESKRRIKEAKDKIVANDKAGLEKRFKIAKEEKLRNRFRLVDRMMSSNREGLFAAITENGDILVYQKEGAPTIETPKNIWKNLISVSVGDNCLYGVKEDGTVIYAESGSKTTVRKWNNIKQVLPCRAGLIGLKTDGTLISNLPSRKYDLTTVNDVIRLLPSIDVDEYDVHVLHSDHTITKINYDYSQGRFNISKLEYYKRTIDVYKYMFDGLLSIDTKGELSNSYDNISYDYTHIKNDGGIIVFKLYDLSYSHMPLAITFDCKLLNGKTTGFGFDLKKRDYMSLLKENGINEIVGVSTTEDNGIFVVSKEGYIYRIDDSSYRPTVTRLFDGQKMFSDFENILENCFFSEERKEKERLTKLQNQQKKEKLMSSYREKGLCQYCGGDFKKSLFGTKCVSCGKPKDY